MALFRRNIDRIRRHDLRDLWDGNQSFQATVYKNAMRAGHPDLLDALLDQNLADPDDGTAGGDFIVINDSPLDNP